MTTRTPAELADALEAEIASSEETVPASIPYRAIKRDLLRELLAHLLGITPGGVVIPEPSEGEYHGIVAEGSTAMGTQVREVVRAALAYARANARVAASVATVMAYEAGMRDGK